MIYANVVCIRDPLKQDLALEFCRKQNKNISILAETHTKHDQIHHIRKNLLGPIFLSPRNIHTKGLLAQLHTGLEGVTDVDTDPKGRFVSFKVTLFNNRVLCVCTSREQLVKDVSLKYYKIIWKIKVRRKKTNLYLETLILLWMKWTGKVEIKHKDFTDVFPKVQDMQCLHRYKNC